eukprot:c268_g1_i2.p1 GENE.c268_g1_i2~~c268_g1_i2.p1  ORF type:complete len:150 (+),score=22.82 c268_g1_i2:297-746(+)
MDSPRSICEPLESPVMSPLSTTTDTIRTPFVSTKITTHDAFEMAVAYLSDRSHTFLSWALTDGDRLAFYGAFKQVRMGPCCTPQPSICEVVARAKWNAWKQLGNMSRNDAEILYLQVLKRLKRSWSSDSNEAFKNVNADLEFLNHIKSR